MKRKKRGWLILKELTYFVLFFSCKLFLSKKLGFLVEKRVVISKEPLNVKGKKSLF